ncbi:hypothetical protein KUTeg_014931 [Tegillarca granosa]|uniref:Uncharacterized protein n=1 Tax=Tegillarca granosa TaxID=220873 RepID=A0ABQ9ENL6_TEGGR|nr:hypothetical protein KUTeg_014931 [Tegillarca granosa]
MIASDTLKTKTQTCCQLCGQERAFIKKSKNLCDCPSVDDCKDCITDVELRTSGKTFEIEYVCKSHGMLRHYEDLLMRYKSWCIVWVTIGIIPFGLTILSTDINLNWAMFTMQVLLAPFLVPLMLTITWSKATSSGIIAGSVSGLIAAIIAMFVTAHTMYPEGLKNFIVNTSQDFSLLAGSVAAIFVSLTICVIVSIKTTTVVNKTDAEEEWEKTFSIDNPLNPWRRVYKVELAAIKAGNYVSTYHMSKIFRKSKYVAYIGGAIGLFLFLVVLPGVMLSFGVLTIDQLSSWILFFQVWVICGACFALFVPPVEEITQILKHISPTIEKFEASLLMVLGFGGFSLILAVIYNAVRKYIFHDSHNLDTSFDAGGKVSLSLTVVTVASQCLWPADLLQSSTTTSKVNLNNELLYGLAGSLWYSLAVTANVLMFPLISVHLKTRAPGAKTFLQIVYHRFGKPAHLVFLFMAFLANITVSTALILAGSATLNVLVKDISNEYIVVVLAVIFGSYCFIGGLGTTFYISYINTSLIFISLMIFLGNIYYVEETKDTVNLESMYEAMKCVMAPDGNYEHSLLTYRSRSAIIIGISYFFLTTSIMYCDQASWQSRIAAKPAQGVLGFLIASCLWFAIPTSLSLASTMTYLSMSYQNGTNLLSPEDIDSGFIMPLVMTTVMGQAGGFLVITMLTMALMSTGSGEVMAISSIIVYDVYRIYINPYRKTKSPTCCVLCGKESISTKTTKKECKCEPVDGCKDCFRDVELRTSGKSYGFEYNCSTHGLYRHYEDLLMEYKSWCIVWVTIGIIPLGLLVLSLDINLNWAMFTMQVLLTPFLAPLMMTIAWSKTTSYGVISGSLSGFLSAIIAMLIIAETVYPEGLGNFIVNTSQDLTLLGGCVTAILVSITVCVFVSKKTTKVIDESDAELEWEKTFSIDNPLNPWRRTYEEELAAINAGTKITTKEMSTIFRKSRLIAYIGGAFGLFMFLVVLPGCMISFEILTFNQFSNWIIFCQIWVLCGACFAILVPPIEEITQILKQYSRNKRNVYMAAAEEEMVSSCKL